MPTSKAAMRVHESTTRRDGAEPHRSPARTPAKAPGPEAATPSRALLAQQGAAGNAAVVQMLRQAGHSWAQHRHGAGCGHRRTGDAGAPPAAGAGTPSVQRMMRYDPVKMNAGYDADHSDYSDHSDAERGRPRRPGPQAAARPASAPRQASPPAVSPAQRAHEIAWYVAYDICAPQSEEDPRKAADIKAFMTDVARRIADEVGAIAIAPGTRDATEFENAFLTTCTKIFEKKYDKENRTAGAAADIARTVAADVRAVLALDRRLQGVHGVPDLPLNELIAPFRTFIRESVEDGETESYKVTVKADRGKPWHTPGFYRDFEVGHVWVQLETGNGKRTSFGFYPKGLAGPVQSVPGMIRCPEPHHAYTDKFSQHVPLSDVIGAYMLAHRRSGESYNFLRYNCTSFAAEIWQAMTGQRLPRGMLVSNPASAGSALYEAYQQAGRSRAGDGATGPFAYSDSERGGA
ncbi:hypothetical protein [Streptomyces sp. NPDC003247]|uniref:hypothetical protein n=1 Tax=Streptomyces sp. NPDC003247 TaxID=3364677 RepID=UPI0036767B7B